MLIQASRSELNFQSSNFQKEMELWIHIGGKVYTEKSPHHEVTHAVAFQELVEDTEEIWNNPIRGYYYPSRGVVTCHSFSDLTPPIIRAISKAIPGAIYIIP